MMPSFQYLSVVSIKYRQRKMRGVLDPLNIDTRGFLTKSPLTHTAIPWSNAKYQKVQRVNDFISYLRCYANTITQSQCEIILNELIRSNRFKLQTMTEKLRETFTKALDVLLNNAQDKTLTFDEVEQLYEDIIPMGVELPFCVAYNNQNYAWFVPVDATGRTWKSCLLFDTQLSEHVRMSQAMYSTPQWPHVTVGGMGMPRSHPISANPYEAVDMLVWLVCEILNRGRWKQGDNQRRMLQKQDYDFVMKCLQQITEQAGNSYQTAYQLNTWFTK